MMIGERGARKPIWVAIIVALMMHLPILPNALSHFLYGHFADPDEEADPLSDEIVMPVELDLGLTDDSPPAPAPTPPPKPMTSETETVLLPASEPEKKSTKPSASASAKPKVPPATSAVPAPEEPPRRAVEDPRRLAGGAGAIGAKHPNVRIYLAMDLIRQSSLAPQLSAILQHVPQWQVLLGGTGIDPLQHFDHLSLSGPHMRSTRVVVAVADFNVSVPRMQNAIDAVVRRSGKTGRWLPGSIKRPVAVVGAKGEHRVHVLRKKRLLAIVPSKAKLGRRKIESLRPFRPSRSVAAGIYLTTPWRAFRRVPLIQIPKRIKWLRLRLSPVAGGRFLLEADAKDVSSKAAKVDAARLEEQVRAIQASMWLFRNRYFDDPVFDVKNDTIRLRVTLTEVQLKRILAQVAGQLNIPPTTP
jgi:hypothetical protein